VIKRQDFLDMQKDCNLSNFGSKVYIGQQDPLISLGEKDPLILANLKDNFNGAVDEYQKMRDIFGGKASAPDNSGGYGKSGDGSGKG